MIVLGAFDRVSWGTTTFCHVLVFEYNFVSFLLPSPPSSPPLLQAPSALSSLVLWFRSGSGNLISSLAWSFCPWLVPTVFCRFRFSYLEEQILSRLFCELAPLVSRVSSYGVCLLLFFGCSCFWGRARFSGRLLFAGSVTRAGSQQYCWKCQRCLKLRCLRDRSGCFSCFLHCESGLATYFGLKLLQTAVVWSPGATCCLSDQPSILWPNQVII